MEGRELRTEVMYGIEESDLKRAKCVVCILGEFKFKWRSDDERLVREDAVKEVLVRGREGEGVC